MKNSKMYFINQSSMPVTSSLMSSSLIIMIVSTMKKKEMYKIWVPIILLSISMLKWSLNVKKENKMGKQSEKSIKILKSSFILFIISEIMIFMSLFWNLMNNSISPNIEVGNKWTPLNIQNPNPFLMASFGSMILIYSGIMATSSHSLLMKNKYKKTNSQMLKSIILGLLFLDMQMSEYTFSNFIMFSINDSNYSNNFFLITGIHGSHVMAGIIMLIVTKKFMKKMSISKKNFSSVEISSWYWHFVDILWLFVFSLIYWINFFS